MQILSTRPAVRNQLSIIRAMQDQDSVESIAAAFHRVQSEATIARCRAATWRRLDVLEMARAEEQRAADLERRLRIAAEALEQWPRREAGQ